MERGREEEGRGGLRRRERVVGREGRGGEGGRGGEEEDRGERRRVGGKVCS